MEVCVSFTDDFLNAYRLLDMTKRKKVCEKTSLLLKDPQNQTLKAHRYGKEGPLWECYVTYRFRLIYKRDNGILCLLDVGRHHILDVSKRKTANNCSYRFYIHQSQSISDDDFFGCNGI